MLVTITLPWQYNIIWYLHHFPVSCPDIPVSNITLSCLYEIFWYPPPFTVSCLGIPVSDKTSSCLYELFWYHSPFSVSCLGIPVPGFHYIFVVIIFSSFLQKTLLLHISWLLLPLKKTVFYLSSSCCRDTWNRHSFYFSICDCFPVIVKHCFIFNFLSVLQLNFFHSLQHGFLFIAMKFPIFSSDFWYLFFLSKLSSYILLHCPHLLLHSYCSSNTVFSYYYLKQVIPCTLFLGVFWHLTRVSWFSQLLPLL